MKLGLTSARAAVAAALLAVACFAGCARPGDSEGPATEPKTGGVIEGVVRESGTDLPIAGADVYVVPRNPRFPHTTTGADGRFALAGLESGRHIVAVSRQGYVLPERTEISGFTFRLTADQRVNAGNLYLVSAGSLAGRVVLPDGKPAREVEIQLLQSLYVMGRQQLMPITAEGSRGPVETNERGEFRLVGIDPGEFLVRLVPRELTSERVIPGGKPPGTVLYPGVREIEHAARVSIRPGGETRLEDVKLPVDQRGWIKVFVFDRSGEDLEGFGQWAIEPPGWIGAGYSFFQEQIVNNAHEFQPDLPGTYEISALWSTPRGPVKGRIAVPYAGRDVEVKMTVEKGPGRVSGRVLLQDPAGNVHPLAGAEVSIGPETPYFARSAEDGTFSMSNVYVGRYKLGYVRGIPPDAYILSASSNKRDVLREDLTVGAGEISRLDVVIGQRGGKIEGKVAHPDGKSARDVLVALVPVGPLRERRDYYGAWQSIRSDQNGTFELRGITPGSYELYAWSGSPASGFRNDDFMKQFAGMGKAVTLEAGQEVTLELKALN